MRTNAMRYLLAIAAVVAVTAPAWSQEDQEDVIRDALKKKNNTAIDEQYQSAVRHTSRTSDQPVKNDPWGTIRDSAPESAKADTAKKPTKKP